MNPPCPIVRLTFPEMYLAGTVAVMRIISNIRENRGDRYGAQRGENGFQYDWLGALGEIACAKHFNLFWSGAIGDYEAIDVGGKMQVRCRSKAWYELPIHPPDNNEKPFVLALAHDLPNITLRGWVYAKEAKVLGPDGKSLYWGDPAKQGRPAFFMPQDKLRPIDELEAIVWGG